MGRQKPMTGMDDVERQAVHGDPEILQQKKKANADRCFRCASLTILVVFLCIVVPVLVLHRDVHYSVAIDSVSGLDPAAAGGLSFNLTLGVSSWSYGAKACIKPGTHLEVSYRGVKLAASEAETGQLCAGPRKSAEKHVAAEGPRLLFPGQVIEGITADMKQGAAVFDVALHLPAGSYGTMGTYDGKKCVSQCGGMRVGAASAWCDAPEQLVVRH